MLRSSFRPGRQRFKTMEPGLHVFELFEGNLRTEVESQRRMASNSKVCRRHFVTQDVFPVAQVIVQNSSKSPYSTGDMAGPQLKT